MSLLTLDHLALSCPTLARGVAGVEAILGIPTQPGGQHGAMSTHNRLLSFGPDEYFEVIAIDPAAPDPGRPRWFDLDNFDGRTRLTNWICRSDDLAASLAVAPAGTGSPMRLERGDLSWSMAVPDDGILPFDGCFPALIQWHGPHPAPRLTDQGCRIVDLTLTHPDADALRAALAPLIDDSRLWIRPGMSPAITATIETPNGPRVLT